jgi:predicted acyltransferase (DUF342 family)
VSLHTDPLDELKIPSGTTVEEHDLVADGDVVVGGRATIEFGLRGHNVLAGEGVRVGGNVEAEADLRLDMWSDVDGNVLVGRDAYVGERVHVGGQLRVAGDLDVGDDVNIEEGFEANGWIVIRNPMPTVVFLFVYLKQLMLLGEDEAAADFAEEAFETEAADEDPLVIPRSATVNDDAWRVSTPATIGDDCRIHGNVRAETIDVGERNNVFGSLRAKGDIVVGEGTRIHGDVTTRNGKVKIAPGAKVLGDIGCKDLELSKNAEVDGRMRARGDVQMIGLSGRTAE